MAVSSKILEGDKLRGLASRISGLESNLFEKASAKFIVAVYWLMGLKPRISKNDHEAMGYDLWSQVFMCFMFASHSTWVVFSCGLQLSRSRTYLRRVRRERDGRPNLTQLLTYVSGLIG